MVFRKERNYWEIIINRVKRYSKLYRYYVEYKTSEHKKSFGNQNPNQIFYLIRPSSDRAGLMSIHNYVAWKIRYALEQGYIPVVDYKNYPNMYLEKDEIGKINSWEYYFKQPTGWNLEDARRSRHVIICDCHLEAGYDGMEDESEIEIFNNLIKEYIQLNKEAEKYVEAVCRALLPVNSKVLGVLGRGTDYASLHPYKHAIVPSEQQLIDKVNELMGEWGGFDYIYLATEDSSIYQTFRKEYGKSLIFHNAVLYDHDTKGQYLASIRTNRKNDKYLKGLEYLANIYLLTKCDSIITPIVGGGLGAIRINGNKYHHKYIFDLGEYS